MKSPKKILATALSASLALSSLSIGIVSISATAVAAKGGNSQGNANSGNRGNSGNSNRGNSANAQSNNGNNGNSNAGGNRGTIARELKNLNAFCANENAFANASADSNIGRIGNYFTTKAETEGAEELLIAAETALADAGESFGGGTHESIVAEGDALIGEQSSLMEELATLQLEEDAARIAEIDSRLLAINAELLALARQMDYAIAADQLDERARALDAATGGRVLSEEALAVFEAGCPR